MNVRRLLSVPVLSLLAAAFAYGQGPVVGVKEVEIFSTEEMKDVVGSLSDGDKVDVVKSLPDKVQVKTVAGTIGWIFRAALCSEEEYHRRWTFSELPARVICVGYGENGIFTYGRRTIRIQNGRLVFIEPDDGIWMDASAKGKDFQGLKGDPLLLFYYNKYGQLAKLPIWQDPPTSKNKKKSSFRVLIR